MTKKQEQRQGAQNADPRVSHTEAVSFPERDGGYQHVHVEERGDAVLK
jgi:hypothetical protein